MAAPTGTSPAVRHRRRARRRQRRAHDLGDGAASRPRRGARAASARRHRHKILIGKDTRALGLHARDRDGVGHLLDGRRRPAGRPDADTGHRVPHPQPARRRRRRDLGVAQSLPGQRHQVLLERRASSCPTTSSSRSSASCSTTRIDHLRPTATEIGKAFRIDDAARPLQRLREEHASRASSPSTVSASSSTAAHGAAYRVAPEVLEELGARRHRDRRRARRREHQPRLRRAAPGALQAPVRAVAARTSASRSTATPTAASSSTSAARWSTATSCWRSPPASCTSRAGSRRTRSSRP